MTCPICSTNAPLTANVCPACGFRLMGEELESPLLENLEQAALLELAGKFELVTRLRASHESLTWLAKDGDSDVILRIHARNRHTEAAIAHTFSPAMAAVSTLEQPHIVAVNAFDRTDSIAWFTRNYVEARSLEAVLTKDGSMTLDACLPIIEQVASALQFAHRHGIIHGNVQPRNIVLNRQGWVFVTDFCAATFLDQARVPARETHRVPRIRYPAPESMQRGFNAMTDQYALAMTLCRCLGITISPDGVHATALAAPAQQPLPRPVLEALRKALSPRPANRFANVLEFVAALSVAESAAVLHPPAPSPRPTQREIPELLFVETPRQRSPWMLAAAALAVLALAGFAAMRWAQRESPAVALAEWQTRESDAVASKTDPAVRSTVADSPLAMTPSPPFTPPERSSAPVREVSLPAREVPASRTTENSSAERTPPRREPPPVRRAPPAENVQQQRVTEARAEAVDERPTATEAPGRLFISSRPWGQIYLDGQPVGNTPKANLVIPAGTHTLRITRPGYRAWERSVTVLPGQEIRLIDIVLQENRP